MDLAGGLFATRKLRVERLRFFLPVEQRDCGQVIRVKHRHLSYNFERKQTIQFTVVAVKLN